MTESPADVIQRAVYAAWGCTELTLRRGPGKLDEGCKQYTDFIMGALADAGYVIVRAKAEARDA